MAFDPSRRLFLKGAGLAALGIGLGPSPLLMRTARAAGQGTRSLVHVFLRGGADGLSMAVPYADPLYYEARGAIALPKPGQEGGVVRLDDSFALHPGFAPLKPLYDDGRLAIVHGVGNYGVSRSHFSAQDFVELGTPGVATTATGLLERMSARLEGGGVTKSVAFSTQRPLSYLGPDPVLVAMNIASFDLSARGWQPEAERLLKDMYAGAKPALARVGADVFEAISLLRTTPELKAGPAKGASYPEGGIGNALRQAAQVLKAGLGTRTIFVNGGGDFDTHSAQVASNAEDFDKLGKALAAFDLDLDAKRDEVVVLVTTEFGRTLRANGALGTDHGSGYCAFVLGGRVKGGRIHGRWPGLEIANLYEERDLAVTTDFRDLFAELAIGHLGIADTKELFPDYAPAPRVGLLG
jgi:uncharacterized protein (DUF1501 family)